MKFTDNYKLGSIEVDQVLDPLEDSRRFLTIDRQLLGLFQIFGNGVVEGWDVTAAYGLSVSISPGRGNVSFMAGETNEARSVADLVPNAISYIYARVTETTRFNRDILFYASQFNVSNDVLLGAVSTGNGAVVTIDESQRNDISFIEEIKQLVNAHRHRGGTDNPTKIDLSKEVMGELPGYRISDIDASKITSGKLAPGRIPKLKHSDLDGRGVLSHAQLDSYVRNLNNVNASLLGEISTINAMQLYLANKHIWNDVDAYATNAIFLIPGISADSAIDFNATTAVIDKDNHTISGIPALSGELLATTFSSVQDFQSVPLISNVAVGSDAFGAFVSITRPVSQLVVDSFDNVFSDGSSFPGWKVETVAASQNTTFLSDSSEKVDGPFSARFDLDQGVRVQATKTFDNVANWTQYSELEISIETTATDHGEIHCQILSDTLAVLDDFKILGTNEITVGFRRVVMDISGPTLTGGTRDKVNGVRIYVDPSLGWDLSVFTFHLDKMQLNNTLFYNPSGRMRFRLKTPQKSQWAAISWTADTNDGKILVRARTAPSFSTFDSSSSIPFSAYLAASGDDPMVDDNLVIEIEVSLLPNDALTFSPLLRSLTVSYITSANNSGITIDTASSFLRASKLENAKVEDAGDVVINGRIDVGDVVYGQNNGIQQTSLTNTAVKQYGTPIVGIVGSLLPLSPIQAVSTAKVASINMAADVIRLKDRTYLVADTGNDRIVLFDRSGNPLRILCTNNVVSETAVYPLSVAYNPVNQTLYIAWSMNVTSSGLDLSQATIDGVGVSIQLSNANDKVVQFSGNSSDIQTANSSAIVLSSTHANQIAAFTASGSVDSRLYLNITASFAQEKVAVSNANYAKLNTIRGLPIFVGDLKFIAGIYRPISVKLTAAGNWLVGNAKPLSTSAGTVSSPITSAVEIVPDTGEILYSDNSVDFSVQFLGNVFEKDGNYFVLAGGVTTTGTSTGQLTGTLNVVDKTTGRLIYQYTTSDGTVASDVQLDVNDNFVVIEKNTTSAHTRIITIDADSNVVFQYDIANGYSAQDVRILSTGNLVIST
jgi:hypothetical protein